MILYWIEKVYTCFMFFFLLLTVSNVTGTSEFSLPRDYSFDIFPEVQRGIHT